MQRIISPAPTSRRPGRTLPIALAVIVALAAIVALSIPATRRMLANPAGQPAALNVSSVDVIGDSFQGHRYAPSVVRVPAGTTITWVFNDRGPSGADAPADHNVVGASWASPILAEGSFSHTFAEPGVFRYTCTLHPGMDGVVEVIAP